MGKHVAFVELRCVRRMACVSVLLIARYGLNCEWTYRAQILTY